MNVEVSADGRGERRIGYEIGALNVFVEGFSHDAAEPPLGPIMTPRYSAEGTTEKLAQSGKIFFMASATRLVASGVGSIPRGMKDHFFILRSRPEMSMERSKLFFRVGRS